MKYRTELDALNALVEKQEQTNELLRQLLNKNENPRQHRTKGDKPA